MARNIINTGKSLSKSSIKISIDGQSIIKNLYEFSWEKSQVNTLTDSKRIIFWKYATRNLSLTLILKNKLLRNMDIIFRYNGNHVFNIFRMYSLNDLLKYKIASFNLEVKSNRGI